MYRVSRSLISVFLISLTFGSFSLAAKLQKEKDIQYSTEKGLLNQGDLQGSLLYFKDSRLSQDSAIKGVQEIAREVIENQASILVVSKIALVMSVDAKAENSPLKSQYWTVQNMAKVQSSHKFSEVNGKTIVRFPLQDALGRALFGDMEAEYSVTSMAAGSGEFNQVMDRLGSLVNENTKPVLIAKQEYRGFKALVKDVVLYTFLFETNDSKVLSLSIGSNTPTNGAVALLAPKAFLKGTTVANLLLEGLVAEAEEFRKNAESANQ